MAEIDWDAFAQVFDDFNTPEYNPILPMFCNWMVDRLDERGDDDPECIVEVGCGTGLVAGQMAEWYQDTPFLLNDDNAAMLQRARDRFAEHAEGIRFVESDGGAFLADLEGDSVEVIVFSRSFYALPDQATAAAEALRALRPDGLVMILDFTSKVDLASLDEYFGPLEPEKWPICRVVYEDFNAGIDAGRYRVYDREGLASLWREAGGTIVAYHCNEPRSNTHFLAITK